MQQVTVIGKQRRLAAANDECQLKLIQSISKSIREPELVLHPK
jgi:hypothetical protein